MVYTELWPDGINCKTSRMRRALLKYKKKFILLAGGDDVSGETRLKRAGRRERGLISHKKGKWEIAKSFKQRVMRLDWILR